MAKIRESRRKAEQRQFSLQEGRKHYRHNLTVSEKEALQKELAHRQAHQK